MKLLPESLQEKNGDVLINLIVWSSFLCFILPFIFYFLSLVNSEILFFTLKWSIIFFVIWMPLIIFSIIRIEFYKTKDILKLSWNVIETSEIKPDKIDEWCNEYILNGYKFLFKTTDGRLVYAIKNIDEAMAFKLRWM